MKLYLISGEASGDLHGSNLIKALKNQVPDVHCRAWGGDLMQKAGAELVKHYRDLSFMGFAEVLLNLRTILGNIAFCKKDILNFQPDALVLIDYPGFNLRIAKWAKEQGIPVIYYISPQIWAWHSSRVHEIKKNVDEMLVILPFEQDFYAKYGMEVQYVGHPLLDAIGPMAEPETRDPKLIALLPGSRKQELKRILPQMLSVVSDFPDYEFVIAASPALPIETYQALCAHEPRVRIATDETYEILRKAGMALVKSGTSTLEAALHGVPQVVCYKGSPVSYEIAKRLVQVKYISLVNLIADKPMVQELIQGDLNRKSIKAALEALQNPENYRQMIQEYRDLRHLLGDSGASERAAAEIFRFLGEPVREDLNRI